MKWWVGVSVSGSVSWVARCAMFFWSVCFFGEIDVFKVSGNGVACSADIRVSASSQQLMRQWL